MAFQYRWTAPGSYKKIMDGFQEAGSLELLIFPGFGARGVVYHSRQAI